MPEELTTIQDINNATEAMSMEYDQLASQVSSLREEHEQILNGINSAKNDLITVRADLDMVNKEIDNQNKALEDIDKNISEKKEDLKKITETVSNKSILLKEKADELEMLLSVIDERQATVTLLNTKVADLQKEFDGNKELFELSHQKNIKEKNDELSSLNEQIQRLRDVKEQTENSIMDLKDKVSLEEKKYNDISKAVSEKIEEEKGLEVSLESAAKQRDAVYEKSKELSKEIETKNDELKTLNEIIKETELESQKKQEEIKSLTLKRIQISKYAEEIEAAYKYIEEVYTEAGIQLPLTHIDFSDL
jgi:chromosome segregation ATPase